MAAFNTQNNAKDNEINVNTRGVNFYNKDGFDPSTMNVGFWNDNFITVKIHPAYPKEKQTQTRVYDYEKEVRATLTTGACQILVETVRTKIIPAIENGEDKTIGVQIGGDSMICVGTGKRQTGEIRPFVAIHKGINPDTRKSELSMYYEFNRGQIIEDYNEDAGTCGKVSSTHNELNVFIISLESAIYALSKAGVHATRTVMRAFNDKLMSSITAIGNKVGADMPSGGKSGGFSSSSRVDWSTGSSDDDDDATYVGSIGDINALMG